MLYQCTFADKFINSILGGGDVSIQRRGYIVHKLTHMKKKFRLINVEGDKGKASFQKSLCPSNLFFLLRGYFSTTNP